MRLIDADAAYKAACEGADNWDGAYSPYRYDRIREEMDKVPTASPRWHRVEEEPKEPGKQYVVWASKGYAYCDKWLGDRWLISSVAPETVTHWMHFEPPKEDNDG